MANNSSDTYIMIPLDALSNEKIIIKCWCERQLMVTSSEFTILISIMCRLSTTNKGNTNCEVRPESVVDTLKESKQTQPVA